MTAAAYAAGTMLAFVGALIPCALLWIPGIALIMWAYARHTDPRRRAQRRARARRGYLHQR